nr:hypothetical protein [Tanacetum cinerariifolium]
MEDASNQGRMIAELDRDTCVVLMDDEETEKKAEDAQLEERQAKIQAEIYQSDMDHASKVVTAASTPVSVASIIIPPVEPKVPAVVPTAAPVRVAAAYTRRRKRVVIKDPEKESTAKTPAETKSKDKGKGIMVEEPKPMKKKDQAKEDKTVQRYQVLKKRPQTEGQDRRNMIMYLKNTAGFRLNYFKGMSYDDIRPIFEAKFNKNIKFLLKSKEQIKEEENRVIKSINKTPAQKAAKWKKLNEEVKELILLVERRYPLSKFTLDQMINAVRLQVEEQSEMSLELLRFRRQQLQEGQHNAAKHKLMLLDIAAERRLMLLSKDKTVNENC